MIYIKNVGQFLIDSDVPFEKCESSFFDEDAKIKNKLTPEFGTKALILRVRDKTDESEKFVIVALACLKKLDIKKLKQVMNYKNIFFATAKEIFEVTEGFEIGGIPPLGNLFNIKTICDVSVFEKKEIIFNAGRSDIFYVVPTAEYITKINHFLVDVTQK